MEKGTQRIPITNPFSKGIIDDVGRNKIPPQFSGYNRNVRIQNASITLRLPNKLVSSWSGKIQGITFNSNIRFIRDGVFCTMTPYFPYTVTPYVVSPDPVGWLTGIFPNISMYNFINYGKYTIILTGETRPFVFDGTILYEIDTSEIVGDDNPINPLNPYPLIWATIQWFTFIAGNTTSTDSTLYISEPIEPDSFLNPTASRNCYRWLGQEDTTNAPLSKLMSSKIQGMIGYLNTLYIFCDKTIEILSQASLSTVWWVPIFTTLPIGDGDTVASHRSIVAAGNIIFYLTKNRRIKTINYIPWIENQKIGELSDRAQQSINGFMERLDEDQSDSFGIYSRGDNTVRWHVKEKWSAVNNLCIVYDITNDWFFIDDNKQYFCMTQANVVGIDQLFGWNTTDGNVYQDDALNGEEEFVREFDTPNISFWNPTIKKKFRGIELAGWLNIFASPTLEVYVDGLLVYSKLFTYWNIDPNQLSNVNIWWPNAVDNPSGSLFYPFELILTQGNLREKGKRIRVRLRWGSWDNIQRKQLYFDYLAFMVKATNNYQLNDKY